MQTGTLEFNCSISKKKYLITIVFLCFGYFIDFYDLTIFSASYVSVFRELFHLTDTSLIQQLYLKISSIYTVGIFCGAILFGVLGDKFGRTVMIRFSILIYSLAMIMSVVATSISVFSVLRFISGFGLASEFATSSVLISELVPARIAAKFTAFLYFCGILGGVTATYIGSISWQIMYLGGGFAGLVLYFLRANIVESVLFIQLKNNISRGQLFALINSPQKILKFLRLLILIMPFNFLIVIMFIYPRFMHIQQDLGVLTQRLLIGFFIGNLLSTIFSLIILQKYKDYRKFMFINIMLYICIMPCFSLINDHLFIYYSIALGFLGGGLPVVWVQLVVRSYGTNLRATATNFLFATGRLSGILFNLLISLILLTPQLFIVHSFLLILAVFMLVLVALFFTTNNFNHDVHYIENT